jgi:NADPH:quinone reductase-like Zn-dependent oxidoreductase
MQQIVFEKIGAPDVLTLRNGADPLPQPDEVLVRVRAAGVNFADVLARMGLYPDAPPPPLVLGYEVAGTVEATGRDVRHVHVGDDVVALTRFGGYATHVTVAAPYVFRRPPDLSDVEAAALPVNYLTALLALYKLANVAAGETVLIHGAGGGVGIAATQLARLRRAIVLGAASPKKHDALRALGVDHPLDYRRGDLTEQVKRLTDGRGVDVILDPIGGKSFEESYRLLAPLGRLVIYGISAIASGPKRSWWRAGRTVLQLRSFKPLSLINRNRGVFGLNLAHLWDEQRQLHDAMLFLIDELRAKRIAPVIARSFPLAAADDAHRFLQSRANVGKVVLTCGDFDRGSAYGSPSAV